MSSPTRRASDRGGHGRIDIAGGAAAHFDVAAIGKYRSVGNVDTHLVAAERGAAEERQRQAGDVDVAAGGLQHGAAVTVEVADAHAGPGEHRTSDERPGGHACFSTCSSRGSTYP